jgi:hypothetical protein
MHTLVDAGEMQLALEILCENVYEFDSPLPGWAAKDIALLGGAVGLDERYLRLVGPEA